MREDTNIKILDEYWSTALHHSVAQILFATPRIRKDIYTAVVFLTKSFRGPDKYNWHKLLRVIQYIRSTIHMPLILRLDNMNIVKWWVETTYTMHPYFWSHTGEKISLGWGSVANVSKRKIYIQASQWRWN